MKRHLLLILCATVSATATPPAVRANPQNPAQLISSQQGVPVSQLVSAIRQRAKSLENTSGMRLAFQSFITAHHLPLDSVRYSDFVIIRLLYEATRDAGFWNVHW